MKGIVKSKNLIAAHCNLGVSCYVEK
jgi:hypothetical protein